MNIKPCRDCGSNFMPVYDQDPQLMVLCEGCFTEQKSHYMKVHAYLRDHPYSTPDEIHAETQVPSSTIIHFMNSGMLQKSPPVCKSCRENLLPEGESICHGCIDKIAKRIRSEKEAKSADSKSSASTAQHHRASNYGIAKR